MNKKHPITSTKSSRQRGETDPAYPGKLFWASYPLKSGAWSELWLTPEEFAVKREKARVNSERDRRTLHGRAYAMMYSAMKRAKEFGRTYEWSDAFRDHIVELLIAAMAAGVCPVLDEPWSDDLDNGPMSMTLDRIEQAEHYGIGTVRIISRRANGAIYSSTTGVRMLLAKRTRMGRDRQMKVADYLGMSFADK